MTIPGIRARWSWDRRSEHWAPPDPQNGGTSVYDKPFLPGVSCQRVIVRFCPYASARVSNGQAFKIPAQIQNTVTLQLVAENGVRTTLAYELTGSMADYRRLSDTDPTKDQFYWATFRPIFWDLTIRHKNTAGGSQTALLELTIACQVGASINDPGALPMFNTGTLQYDALFTQPSTVNLADFRQ